MKKSRISLSATAPALALGLFLSLAGTPLLRAQSYQIHPSHFPGGGGSGQAGNYHLRGSLGGMPAARAAAGSYALQGGFWGLPGAVQTPGAPVLAITRGRGSVIVSWPASATEFTLQVTRELGPAAAWTTLPNLPQTNQGAVFLILPLERGSRFFRLIRANP